MKDLPKGAEPQFFDLNPGFVIVVLASALIWILIGAVVWGTWGWWR